MEELTPEPEKIFDVAELKDVLTTILNGLDSYDPRESNSARGKFLQLKEEIDLQWDNKEMPGDILHLYEEVEEKIEKMNEDNQRIQKEARGEATA